jgi:hypothetical protein
MVGEPMYGTFFSALIALFVLFNPFGKDVIPGENMMGITLIIIATVFVILQTFALAMAWWPLQRAERDFTPRILQLFKKDVYLRLINMWVLFFPILSYAIAVDLMFLHIFPKKTLLAFWIFFLGVSVDVTRYTLIRILNYLDPFGVVTLFSKEANVSIRNSDTKELCNWLDALSEIAIKAVMRPSTSLANHAINAIPPIVDGYLKSLKSISHKENDGKLNYVLYTLFQRLEMINVKAAEERLEPVCDNLINATGKIAVHAANFDISLSPLPLQVLGHLAHTAQGEEMTEVADRATCTLVEVANAVIHDVDLTYVDIKEFFLSLISELEEITKEEFRQDKTMNIKILKHPFEELKKLVAEGKIAEHTDAKIVIQDIHRVLAEFTELEAVMRTVPPMPDVKEEEA